MINNRRRGSSNLIVSFCNVKDRNKPIVASVDLREEAVHRVRWLEIEQGTFLKGATGLCYWQEMICVAH